MAQIENTLKQFNFVLEADGVDQMEIQKVTRPEITVGVVTHGQGNRDVKTPGRVTVGDLVLEGIRNVQGSGNKFYDWLLKVQNIYTGGGNPISDTYELIIVKEMNEGGINGSAISVWEYGECWLSGFKPGDLDRSAEDNVMNVYTLTVGLARQLS